MDEEYCKLLEEYVEHLSMALIVDMIKKGIFVDSTEEIKLEKKFIDEVKREYETLDVEDKDEKAVAAVLNALTSYYGPDMYEEEMLPRANIILNFMGDQLEEK